MQSMNLLSASLQAQGILWCILLFVLCIIVVHAIKLSSIGYRTMHKNLPDESPKISEKKPEPVYFIVEKKKKNAKTSYSEPKEVSFKG